jgi:hypothetical protein
MKYVPKKPPKSLGREGRAWFKQTAAESIFYSAPEWELLTQAAATLDRIHDCQRSIAKDGLTVPTGAGSVKPHPAAGLERDHRILFARLLAQLHLTDLCDRTTERVPAVATRRR